MEISKGDKVKFKLNKVGGILDGFEGEGKVVTNYLGRVVLDLDGKGVISISKSEITCKIEDTLPTTGHQQNTKETE